MPTHHTGRKAFLFVACLVSGWLPSVCSRALVRSSPSSVAPSDAVFNGKQYAHDFRSRGDHELVSTNVSTTDTIHNDVLSFSSTKRVHRRAGNQPPPATDDAFTSSAAKGCSMHYMLAANADDALARLKANNPSLTSLSSSQSPWDNAGALKQYGWTDKKDSVNWAYMGINEVMKELAIDTTSDDNKNIQLVQDTAVTVDGKSYVASKGTYNQAINVAAGLVIPYYIYSPRNEAQTNNIQGEVVPFAQYSDVLYLEYLKLAGRAKADIKSLKHLLFLNVENQNTWSIVLKALMNKNDGKMDIPLWPGTEFSMNDADGKALLGTQIGGPVAWLFIQHKEAFGPKSVVKVRVFRNKGMTNQDTDQPYPSLLFYIGDAAKMNHCDPADTCCCPKFEAGI